MNETIDTIPDEAWPTIAVIAVTAAATVAVVKTVDGMRNRRWMRKHYPKARKI